MRSIFISALALAASGCAMFDGGERSAMSGPASAPVAEQTEAQPTRTAARGAFKPAFGIGSPVALVPCRNKVTLGGDCRSLNDRHQVAGDIPADADRGPLAEASIAPVKD